ncbi:galactose/N-acetylgalactosamine-binding lectin CEL-III-like [Rhopilema esculentum]|uniref:galactose/N-acetylgalactosamine-binding lectin CEL-III-like n=1 Tax=Rhopilema esculentum TaxID=499914 RepID=UPI0031D128AE
MESGKCLDVQGTDGTGKIQVYKCENKNDQYFYFRSRGKQIAFGRLINEKSGRCLDVSGSDGKGNIKIYKCEDKQDQWFRFYQNGEIVNEKSKRCVDVSGSDGTGNIQTYYCEDKRDQMWSQPKKLCNGNHCSFVNKRSNKCLDVSGKDGKGGVKTYDCEGLSDQRFKWEAGKWTPPIAKWFMVGCNKNGKVSHSITNSVAYGSTVTKTVTIEVASSIESGLKFGSASVSISVSSSLSTAWTKSHSEASRIDFACEFHDSGAQFKGGCMWQLQVDTKKVSTGRWLTWKPQIVRCTSSDKEPSCPPFRKCSNKGCTRCKKM